MLNKTKRTGEVLVVGTGPAGMSAALRSAERGGEVQLIDQDRANGHKQVELKKLE